MLRISIKTIPSTSKSIFYPPEKLTKLLQKRGGSAVAKVKDSAKSKSRPALTPEAKENQMIALAMDLAEQQLRDGTASSQLITEFVKRGSDKARLENEKLRRENELLKARTEAMESAKEVEKLYKEALAAMRNYSGNGEPNEY